MPGSGLDGLRVLIVEDEMIVALHLQEELLDVGCAVVGPVGTVEAALALVQGEVLDAAVLDVNLDGDRAFPIAEALQARGIPFALATGYGAPTLPERWREQLCLRKPFTGEELGNILQVLAVRAGRSPN